MDSRMILLGIATGLTTLAGFTAPRVRTDVAAVPAATTAAVVPTNVSAPAPVAATNSVDDKVESALTALASSATTLSHTDALKLAFQAYFNYKAEHAESIKKPYLYFVDYGLSNTTPRGYVFDMDKLELVDGPFIVAHGRGSSAGKYGVPKHFGNSGGSGTTSLGLYTTGETYTLNGHAGGGTYSSIALRMDGHSGRFNSAARNRGVVIHGAPYVTPTGSGRSLGCPAMEMSRARKLIPMIAGGSVVFLFSPNDATWMSQDPWING